MSACTLAELLAHLLERLLELVHLHLEAIVL